MRNREVIDLSSTLTLLLPALFAGGYEFNQRRLKPITTMINTIRLIDSIGDGEIDGYDIGPDTYRKTESKAVNSIWLCLPLRFLSSATVKRQNLVLYSNTTIG